MVLADFPFDSNVIVVLVAVIFAALKAFLERNQKGDNPDPEEMQIPSYPVEEEEEEIDYSAYEAELERQRSEMELQLPPPLVINTPPPPLPEPAPEPKPSRPSLSAAEKQALENFNRRSKRRRGGPLHPGMLSTRSRVIRHLSSPTAAREALVLAEVLGPPKAFKDKS